MPYASKSVRRQRRQMGALRFRRWMQEQQEVKRREAACSGCCYWRRAAGKGEHMCCYSLDTGHTRTHRGADGSLIPAAVPCAFYRNDPDYQARRERGSWVWGSSSEEEQEVSE